jgi:hypothetical protein
MQFTAANRRGSGTKAQSTLMKKVIANSFQEKNARLEAPAA